MTVEVPIDVPDEQATTPSGDGLLLAIVCLVAALGLAAVVSMVG